MPAAPAHALLHPLHHRRLKMDGPYDSRALPVILAITLITSLLVVFSGAIVRLHSDAA